MSIIKIEDIVAYEDDENIYCLDCAEQNSGLKPITRDQIPDDKVTAICDTCGEII